MVVINITRLSSVLPFPVSAAPLIRFDFYRVGAQLGRIHQFLTFVKSDRHIRNDIKVHWVLHESEVQRSPSLWEMPKERLADRSTFESITADALPYCPQERAAHIFHCTVS